MQRVSIVIPAYNNPAYLTSALKSIISQTYVDFEVVLIDDCSPKNLRRSVESMNDKRIKYFRNKSNLGFARNLKKGFSLADGEYIVIMCDADIMFPTCLEVLVKYMDKNVNCSAGRSGFVRFDNNSKKICFATPQKKMMKFDRGFDSITNFLSFHTGFSTGNIIRKKMMTRKIGTGLQTCFLEPIIDSLKDNEFMFIPNYLIADRLHMSAGYTIFKEKKDLYDEIIEMFDDVFTEKKFAYSKKVGLHKFIYGSFLELTNMKISAGEKKLLKKLLYLIHHFPGVITKYNFYIFSTISILLPSRVLLFLKRTILNYKAKQLSKKTCFSNLEKIINQYETLNQK